MFERFTDRARRVLVEAQNEAAQLRHNFIGTEHILLGLMREGEGVGAKALESLGVTLEAARAMVTELIGPAGESATGAPPFTPRAKKVLELSLREALQLGHNYIGTEHMLLGLVHEGEGVAAVVLQRQCGELSRVRQQVIQILSDHGAGTGSPGAASPDVSAGNHTPGLRDAMLLATGLAHQGPVGTQHLLAVLARTPGTAAHAILSAGGFDIAKLDSDPADWVVSGTSDETPLQAAAAATRVDLESEDLVVRLTDPELAGRIRDAIQSGGLHPERVQLEIGKLWQTLDQLREPGTPDATGSSAE